MFRTRNLSGQSVAGWADGIWCSWSKLPKDVLCALSCVLLRDLGKHLTSGLYLQVTLARDFSQNSPWKATCGHKQAQLPISPSLLNDTEIFCVLSAWILHVILLDCSFHIKEASFNKILSKCFLILGHYFMNWVGGKETKSAFVPCMCVIVVAAFQHWS